MSAAPCKRSPKPPSSFKQGIWSQAEHDLFLEALRVFPQGPWAAITDAIGTRSVRQVQTHAQKYYEKVMRRLRGTHKDRKSWARCEHRIDDDVLSFCTKKMSGGCTGSVDLVVVGGGDSSSEFEETNSSSSECSSDSQESQDSLEDDLEVISWDKFHAEAAVTTTATDSEWMSFDDSLDYLIAFLAE